MDALEVTAAVHASQPLTFHNGVRFRFMEVSLEWGMTDANVIAPAAPMLLSETRPIAGTQLVPVNIANVQCNELSNVEIVPQPKGVQAHPRQAGKHCFRTVQRGTQPDSAVDACSLRLSRLWITAIQIPCKVPPNAH